MQTNQILKRNSPTAKNIRTYLIGSLVLSGTSLIVNSNPFGIFSTLLLLQSILSSDYLIGYILYTGITLLLTIFLTYLSLRLLKVKDSLLMSAAAAAIFHLIDPIAQIYVPSNIALNIGIFYILAVASFLGALIISKYTKSFGLRRIFAFVACIVLIGLQPFIFNPLLARHLAKAESEKRKKISINLDFKVYFPDKPFEGLIIKTPYTTNYPKSKISVQNPAVVFYIGNIKVEQGAMPASQSYLMNYTDNCDVLGLAYDFSYLGTAAQNGSSVSARDSCAPAFITPSGKRVYAAYDKSKYFIQINNTDIFINNEYDYNSKSPSYDQYIPTVEKIIDSMREIDNSKITLGYDAIYQ